MDLDYRHTRVYEAILQSVAVMGQRTGVDYDSLDSTEMFLDAINQVAFDVGLEERNFHTKFISQL